MFKYLYHVNSICFLLTRYHETIAETVGSSCLAPLVCKDQNHNAQSFLLHTVQNDVDTVSLIKASFLRFTKEDKHATSFTTSTLDRNLLHVWLHLQLKSLLYTVKSSKFNAGLVILSMLVSDLSIASWADQWKVVRRRRWAERGQSGLDCTSILVSLWQMFRSLGRNLPDLRLFLYRSELTSFSLSLPEHKNTKRGEKSRCYCTCAVFSWRCAGRRRFLWSLETHTDMEILQKPPRMYHVFETFSASKMTVNRQLLRPNHLFFHF